MNLEEIVRSALDQKASDVHIEPRLPGMVRAKGQLKRLFPPIDSATTRAFAERLLNDEEWSHFQSRGSCDFSRVIAGVQCRINVIQSDRGIGFAIRLLSTSENTLKSCNLHPCLAELLDRESGLIILTGSTGSGKSTTLSAMIEEINSKESRHIITLESPIEYRLTPKKSLIRQREIGLHTPSFEQGLLDSLREDPDVLVVGEMREPEAMRLTLNAAETGHLVLATMHSANAADAVSRLMMSFPPERQGAVLAQIADTLVAIVSQRLTFKEDLGLLVPVCEILVATHAVRHVIRKAEVSKLQSLLQSGGSEGLWTFERYQSWLDTKEHWTYPKSPEDNSETMEPLDAEMAPAALAVSRATAQNPRPERSDAMQKTRTPEAEKPKNTMRKTPSRAKSQLKPAPIRLHKDGRIEITAQEDMDLNELVKEIVGDDED